MKLFMVHTSQNGEGLEGGVGCCRPPSVAYECGYDDVWTGETRGWAGVRVWLNGTVGQLPATGNIVLLGMHKCISGGRIWLISLNF